MVKIGIICEGHTEQILLQGEGFNALLQQLGIELVQVINAGGSGNLLPHNIIGYIDALQIAGADRILIVTDLDDDVCVTFTKQRINAPAEIVTVIAVKQIESWYLADTTSMRLLLQNPDFYFEQPEQEGRPFDVINNLMVEHLEKGIGKSRPAAKIKLAKRMLGHGWQVERAAIHKNCSSAAYLLKSLQQLVLP